MGLKMSNDRYVKALKRQRDRIANGLAFFAIDSEASGDKYTSASWGLCSKDAAAWPDADDHLWPDKFVQSGRVAPKYREQHQPCPMQKKGGAQGCFYSCRIFKSREITGGKRAEAVALYDAMIARKSGQPTP